MFLLLNTFQLITALEHRFSYLGLINTFLSCTHNIMVIYHFIMTSIQKPHPSTPSPSLYSPAHFFQILETTYQRNVCFKNLYFHYHALAHHEILFL